MELVSDSSSDTRLGSSRKRPHPLYTLRSFTTNARSRTSAASSPSPALLSPSSPNPASYPRSFTANARLRALAPSSYNLFAFLQTDASDAGLLHGDERSVVRLARVLSPKLRFPILICAASMPDPPCLLFPIFLSYSFRYCTFFCT
jgi:hypothetical protein